MNPFAGFFSPKPIEFIWAVSAASVIGFMGNELVAKFRIKMGKEIISAALVADGYHARADGFSSLAVLFGAVGVWVRSSTC
jgi:divalent metal cation (Fe/Co/Zn/Cd) transporter